MTITITKNGTVITDVAPHELRLIADGLVALARENQRQMRPTSSNTMEDPKLEEMITVFSHLRG